ncbi:hypothetical protein HX004_11830 [Myroides sp. 1354]|nr:MULTISPECIES: hypothetical protein [unclassified Myroides]MDM1045461.1 hypothetical protein [Myroides sp. R163-1]MDM1056463.1 hypothetical protein [Myroides sp. 1354]MDM1069667.1 hypothetical protein [Myroides sp. 1372]
MTIPPLINDYVGVYDHTPLINDYIGVYDHTPVDLHPSFIKTESNLEGIK